MGRVYRATAANDKNEYYHSRLSKFLTRVFYTLIVIPLLFLWMRLVNGVRIRGIRNLWGLQSALTVCNHVHLLDSALVGIASFPRKLIFSTIPENLETLFPGVIGQHFGWGPGAPRAWRYGCVF